MLKRILALTLGLALTGCARQLPPIQPPEPPPVTTPPEPKPVVPETPGFTTHTGDDWSVVLPNSFATQENEDVNFVAYDPITSSMVLVFSAETDMSLAQYVKDSIESIRDAGMRLTSLKKVQWLGHDAAAIELLKPSKKGVAKASHWATISNGKVYNLGCIVVVTKSDDGSKLCKAVFDSFKVTPVKK